MMFFFIYRNDNKINVIFYNPDVAVTAGTATSADFIVPVTTRASFATDAYFYDMTFQINTDNIEEDLESFTVTLQNPTGGIVIEPVTTTVFIIDESGMYRQLENQRLTSTDALSFFLPLFCLISFLPASQDKKELKRLAVQITFSPTQSLKVDNPDNDIQTSVECILIVLSVVLLGYI